MYPIDQGSKLDQDYEGLQLKDDETAFSVSRAKANLCKSWRKGALLYTIKNDDIQKLNDSDKAVSTILKNSKNLDLEDFESFPIKKSKKDQYKDEIPNLLKSHNTYYTIGELLELLPNDPKYGTVSAALKELYKESVIDRQKYTNSKTMTDYYRYGPLQP